MDIFKDIKLKFLSGIPVKQIDFKGIFENLEWNQQEEFIKRIILDTRNVKYPLKKDYQISFIKYIIEQLESNGISEIQDLFYELLAIKLEEADSEFSYKHFKVTRERYITMKEANSFIRDGTTGLKLWPAAVTLSNYIIQNSKIFDEKSIIEIGSGCSGLVGLTLLLSCRCKQVFLSDCHSTVLNNLIENINLNLDEFCVEKLETSLLIRHHLLVEKSCEFGVLNLPWEDILDHEEELVQKCHIDTIIAADIIYDSSIFEALIKCLNILFKIFNIGGSLQFILSQAIRNYETFDNFCTLLRRNSFNVLEISLDDLRCSIPFSSDPLNVVKMFQITK